MHFGRSASPETDRLSRRVEGEGARGSTNREDGSFSRTEFAREIDWAWGASCLARRRTRLHDDFFVDLRALGEEVVRQSWQRNGGNLPRAAGRQVAPDDPAGTIHFQSCHGVREYCPEMELDQAVPQIEARRQAFLVHEHLVNVVRMCTAGNLVLEQIEEVGEQIAVLVDVGVE